MYDIDICTGLRGLLAMVHLPLGLLRDCVPSCRWAGPGSSWGGRAKPGRLSDRQETGVQAYRMFAQKARHCALSWVGFEVKRASRPARMHARTHAYTHAPRTLWLSLQMRMYGTLLVGLVWKRSRPYASVGSYSTWALTCKQPSVPFHIRSASAQDLHLVGRLKQHIGHNSSSRAACICACVCACVCVRAHAREWAHGRAGGQARRRGRVGARAIGEVRSALFGLRTHDLGLCI